jgi:hypothetical protein
MAGFIKGRDFVDLVSTRRLSDGTHVCAGYLPIISHFKGIPVTALCV